MRPGYPYIIAGVAIGALSGATMVALGDLPDPVTWGGVDIRLPLGLLFVLGAGVTVYGIRKTLRSPSGPAQGARADAQLIFRAMLALAGLDGNLGPDEVTMIQRCCAQFFKRDMSEADIRKAFAHHTRTSSGGFSFEGVDQSASQDARAFAYTTAMLVAKSDGEVTPEERKKLASLAAILALTDAQQARGWEEAERLYAAANQA